jgi:hypothetical protein
VKITGLLTTPLDRQLHELVYGIPCRANRWAGRMATSGRPNGALVCVADVCFKNKYWHDKARQVAAVSYAWQHVIHQKWPAGDPIAERMLKCVPAGVYTSQSTYRECRRYTVCPFCWYRKLRSTLLPLVGLTQGYIATLVVLPSNQNLFPTLADTVLLSKLCSNIVFNTEAESCLVLKRPFYLNHPTQPRWTVAGIIIAHVRQIQQLADPSKFRIASQWNAQPANTLVTRLRGDLKPVLQYNPYLWRIETTKLEWLRDLTSKLRSRYSQCRVPACSP